MEAQITLGDIVADVILKDIKNVHLSVYPPNGHVRISAPERMSIDNVRAYAVSKLRCLRTRGPKRTEFLSVRVKSAGCNVAY